MKTDELVRMLAADATVEAAPARQMVRAAIPAVILALALFLALVGVRADIVQALGTMLDTVVF